jgi:hypothetical protein
MTVVNLNGGAYVARSLLASAQRCVNLYPEALPPEQGEAEETKVTHYPTPGLTLLATASDAGWRCLYRSSLGTGYGVSGATVYAISSSWVLTAIGTINAGTTICSMADNGLDIILVDGSANGWTINLATNAFAQIFQAGFYGGTFVTYIDTFFLLNKPGTNEFYQSNSLSTFFDPLNFAAKAATPDLLVAVVMVDHQLWLLGTSMGTELWNNVGAAAFPFQIVPGVFIAHGVAAPYSLATMDNAIFWLSRSLAGETMILLGSGYKAERISTHAMEEALRGYSVITDAEGYCYQQDGHEFYMLTFPTAGHTWCFDRATKQWHERPYIDNDGNEQRHRSRVAANLYQTIVCGDFATGALYEMDLDAYTDAGQPIKRVLSFPHITAGQNRISYQEFIAIMECGSTGLNTDSPLSLRWSDDGGRTWGNPVVDSFGMKGAYLQSIQFQRLGMARSRVFELSWSANAKTAVIGASIDMKKMAS